MTPLQEVKNKQIKSNCRWESSPHLSPEKAGQTKRATTASTQDEHARKYDQK